MDTRSISSRKAGILAAAVLLCICSAVMMLRYQDMADWVDSMEDIGTRQTETLYEMGDDLSEGNYLLYNEYSQETAFSDVLEWYGQSPFELLGRYMDYGIFDSEGESLLSDTSETEAQRLAEEESQYYAFRASFYFGEAGELSDIQVDGSALEPKTAYSLEQMSL